MKKSRRNTLIASALAVGVALGSVAGVAGVASAAPDQAAVEAANGTVTTVMLEESAALFQYKPGDVSYMYIGHLSKDARDNAILNSGLSEELVTTAFLDETGAGIAQAPDEYIRWSKEVDVEGRAASLDDDLKAMRVAAGEKKYDEAASHYAKAVSTLIGEESEKGKDVDYAPLLVLDNDSFATEGLVQIFKGEVAVPEKVVATPNNKQSGATPDGAPRPTVNARGDDNYRMVDVSGRTVRSDKVIENHIKYGGGN